jgi:hypothetical protein
VADLERALLIKILADAAQALGEFDLLKAKIAETTAAQGGVASGATAATAALDAEGAAAKGAAAGLGATASEAAAVAATQGELAVSIPAVTTELRTEISTLSGVDAAMLAARSAMAALTEATVVGGAALGDALAGVVRSFTVLEAEMAKARASGKVIAPETIEELGRYQAQLNGLVASLGGASAAFDSTRASASASTSAVTEAGAAAGLSAEQLQALGAGAGLSATQLSALGEQTGLTAAQTAALTAEAGSAATAQTGLAGAAESAVGGLEAEAGASQAAGAALGEQASAAAAAGTAQAELATSAATAAGGLGQEAIAAESAGAALSQEAAAAAQSAESGAAVASAAETAASGLTTQAQAATAAAGALERESVTARAAVGSTDAIAASVANARAALDGFAAAMAGSGQTANVAFQEAKLAIDGLASRIAFLRTTGQPIPPEAIQALRDFRLELGNSGTAAYEATIKFYGLNPALMENWRATDLAYAAALKEATALREQAAAAQQTSGALQGATGATRAAATAGAELAQSAGLSAAELAALGEGAGLSAAQLATLGEQTGLTAAQSSALTAGASSLEAALSSEGAAAQAAAASVTEAGAAAAGAAQFETLLTTSLRENANAHVLAYEAAVAAAGGEEAYTAATNAATAAAAARASSENAVIGALRETRVAMGAATVAVETGSAGMVAAVAAAVAALGGLLIETEAVRAAGGIITPAQQTQIETYILQLRELAIAAGLTATELQAASTAAAASAGGFGRLTPVLTQGANAMTGASVQVGALGGRFLALLGPVGLAVAAIALVPTAIRGLDKATREYYTWIVNLISGFHDSEVAVRQSGESLEKYDARVQQARDAIELLTRAQYANKQGLIDNTGSTNRLTAAYLIHQAAMNGTIGTTKDLDKAAKDLNLTITKSITFVEAQQEIQAFFNAYAGYLKQGENDARRFAESQKESIKLWMEEYEDRGIKIPAALQKIATELGVLTFKQKEATEETKKATAAAKDQAKADEEARKAKQDLIETISDQVVKFRDLDRAYREDAAEIEKHRAKSVTAAHEAADAARQSAVDQLNALNERKRNAQISNAEYQAEYTRILDEERIARQAALDDERRVNDEAAKDLKKVGDAFKDKSLVVRQELANEGTSLTAAEGIHDSYIAKLDATIKRVNEHASAHAKAAEIISGAGSQLVTTFNNIVTAVNAADAATDRFFATGSVTVVTEGTPASAGVPSIPGGSVTTTPSF